MLATNLTTATKVKTNGTDLATFSYQRVPFELLRASIPAEYLPKDTERSYSVLFLMDMNSTEGAIQIDSNRPLAATWNVILAGQRKLASEIDIYGNLI
jgi:hypothetical protein